MGHTDGPAKHHQTNLFHLGDGGHTLGLLGLLPGSETSGWEWPWLFPGDAVQPRPHSHTCFSEALNPDTASRASLCGSGLSTGADSFFLFFWSQT